MGQWEGYSEDWDVWGIRCSTCHAEYPGAESVQRVGASALNDLASLRQRLERMRQAIYNCEMDPNGLLAFLTVEDIDWIALAPDTPALAEKV